MDTIIQIIRSYVAVRVEVKIMELTLSSDGSVQALTDFPGPARSSHWDSAYEDVLDTLGSSEELRQSHLVRHPQPKKLSMEDQRHPQRWVKVQEDNKDPCETIKSKVNRLIDQATTAAGTRIPTKKIVGGHSPHSDTSTVRQNTLRRTKTHWSIF